MKMEAVGLVEVLGSASAIVIVDKMVKTSEVSFECWHTKCGGHVTVFVVGDVAAVTEAVEAAVASAPCEVFASAVISGPSEETIRILEENRAEFQAKREKK